MNLNRTRPTIHWSAVAISGLAILVLAAAPALCAARGPLPEGRTYFTVITGVGDTPYAVEAACLEFDVEEMCVVGGDCFQFSRIEGTQERQRVSFSFEGSFPSDNEDIEISLVGQGRAEDRGRRSSFAGAGVATAQDPDTGQTQSMNLAFSGRETGRGRCQQLVEDFETAMSSINN